MSEEEWAVSCLLASILALTLGQGLLLTSPLTGARSVARSGVTITFPASPLPW